MRLSLGDSPRTHDPAPPAHSEAAAPSPASLRAEASPFARLVHGIGHELNRGEQIMRAAVDSMKSGGDFAPAQLIALQAGVYRYSEAIDLASRVVDRTTSGVKTVLQGSGQ